MLLNDPAVDHEYLPIIGMPEYTSAAARLILSPQSPALNEGRVVRSVNIALSCHSPSSWYPTAYRLSPVQGRTTLARSSSAVSTPSMDQNKSTLATRPGVCPVSSLLHAVLNLPHTVNHFAVFRNVGIDPVTYPYYDPTTVGLNFNGFLNALQAAPERSVFLLHACAHNPTGVDPTEDQWRQFADVFLEKGHFAFFDCAYQGFASGDLDRDARSVRLPLYSSLPLFVPNCHAVGTAL